MTLPPHREKSGDVGAGNSKGGGVDGAGGMVVC